MQTDWIEAFLAVVDQQGFAAASAYLYRSQGRVSSYIAAIESELGVRLFDRSQRPVVLTAEGVAFLPHARQLLDTLDSARSAALAVQHLARGGVALATYPSASVEYVPRVMITLSQYYPNVAIELVERASSRIDQALAAGEAQVAIRPTVPEPLGHLQLSYAPLWQESLFLVVPDGHRLASNQVVEPEEFRDEPIVVGGHGRRDTEFLRQLGQSAADFTIKYRTEQPQTLVSLVRHGLAVGVVNDLALRSIRLDGVHEIPLVSPMRREVGLFWSHSAEVSTATSALVRAVLSTPPPPGTADIRRSDDPQNE